MKIAGGLALCLLGLKIYASSPRRYDSRKVETVCRADGHGLTSAYLSTLLLTLANPATILFFMAAFAGLGMADMDAGIDGGTNAGIGAGANAGISAGMNVGIDTSTCPIEGTGAVGGMGGYTGGGSLSGIILVAGVFTGSSMWWLLLSSGFGLLKDRLASDRVSLFNRIAGALILCTGLYALFISLLQIMTCHSQKL